MGDRRGSSRPRRSAKRRPAGFDAFADELERTDAIWVRALVHLRRFFKGRRVDSITASLTAEYGIRRQEQDATIETIKLELLALEKILRLAVSTGIIKDFLIVYPSRTREEEAAAADRLAAASPRRWPGSLAAPATPGPEEKRGRPRSVTLEEYREDVRKFPTGPKASASQRARRLGVSRHAVNRLKKRAPITD